MDRSPARHARVGRLTLNVEVDGGPEAVSAGGPEAAVADAVPVRNTGSWATMGLASSSLLVVTPPPRRLDASEARLHMSQPSPGATLATLRRLLWGVLLFGLLGTGTELLLIGHDEDVWQLIPLVVLAAAIAVSLAMLAIAATRPTAATFTIRMFRLTMVLLILSGGTGSVLHYRANMEFKREMDPSLSGFALFSSALEAKTPPGLAPGTLVLFGLLGLASVFRFEVETQTVSHVQPRSSHM
jgi:hypothetical protein